MTDYSDSVIEFANVIVALDAIASYGVSVTESVSAMDTSSALNISSEHIAESVSTTDVLDGFATSHIVETISITDKSNVIPVYNLKFADFISPIDKSDIESYTLNSNVTESVSITDTSDAFISETVAESVSVTDTSSASITINVVETVSITETMVATGISLTAPRIPSIYTIPNPVQVREYYKNQLRILNYIYRKSPL
jgi:hypothetical protein